MNEKNDFNYNSDFEDDELKTAQDIITSLKSDKQKPIIKKILNNGMTITQMDNQSFNDMEPTVFLCERLNLQNNTLNTIIASGNSGKTWLIDYLSVCVSSGLPFLGKYPITKGKVLLIDQEQSERQTKIRLIRIANSLGASVSNIYRTEIPKIEHFEKKYDFKKWLTDSIKQLGINYVFIDSLRRVTIKDENTGDISIPLEILKDITKELNVAIIVIHHQGKGLSTVRQNGRGHSTIYDVPDLQIDLTSEVGSGVFNLSCGKVRDGLPFEDINYGFKDEGNYNLNIKKHEKITFYETEPETKLTLSEQIIELLKDGKLSKTDIKQKIKSKHTAIIDELDRLAEIGKIVFEKDGKTTFCKLVES